MSKLSMPSQALASSVFFVLRTDQCSFFACLVSWLRFDVLRIKLTSCFVRQHRRLVGILIQQRTKVCHSSTNSDFVGMLTLTKARVPPDTSTILLPYECQVFLLHQVVSDYMGPAFYNRTPDLRTIQVYSVDEFRGCEDDCVVVPMVYYDSMGHGVFFFHEYIGVCGSSRD